MAETDTDTSGSMAIWAQHNGAGPGTIEVHVNFWRLSGHRRFWWRTARDAPSDLIEIGVMLSEPRAVEAVSLFVPAAVRRDEVEDLGQHFSRVELAEGIFNEDLSCTSASGRDWIELNETGGQPFCRVHVFAEVDKQIDPGQLELATLGSGTLVKISKDAIESSCRDLPPNGRLYFRLRFSLGRTEGRPFVLVRKPIDRWFQSGFEQVEYIDFRFNEPRTLPDVIERSMRGVGAVPIEKLAFLIIVPVNPEMSSFGAQQYKSRRLEAGNWRDYIRNIPKEMIVYHWRKTDGVRDFSVFIKLRARLSNRMVLATYLVIAFLFAIAGNLTANYIQSNLLDSAKKGVMAPWMETPVQSARSIAHTRQPNLL